MTNEELDELVARLRPMNGCNEFDEAVAALTALRDERDALKTSNAKLEKEVSEYAEANHRQALCLNFTASALGDEISTTIEGLPKAARHVRDRAEAAEARVAEMEAANKNYAEQLSSAVAAAEAAALERAAQWHDGEKHRIINELSCHRFAGNERLWLDAADDHEACADAIRALIAPAARTALEAALADARREQSDYVKALEDALRKLELANDRVCGARPQRVYNLMIAAGMSDALIALDDARREAMRALATRVEGESK